MTGRRSGSGVLAGGCRGAGDYMNALRLWLRLNWGWTLLGYKFGSSSVSLVSFLVMLS